MSQYFLKLQSPVERKGCQRVECTEGLCIVSTGPTVRLEHRACDEVVEDHLIEIEFVAFERYYRSLHESLVQHLHLKTRSGNNICLEREIVVGWSGQGGRPYPPWSELYDFGIELSVRYQVPFRCLPPGDLELNEGCPD